MFFELLLENKCCPNRKNILHYVDPILLIETARKFRFILYRKRSGLLSKNSASNSTEYFLSTTYSKIGCSMLNHKTRHKCRYYLMINECIIARPHGSATCMCDCI